MYNNKNNNNNNKFNNISNINKTVNQLTSEFKFTKYSIWWFIIYALVIIIFIFS